MGSTLIKDKVHAADLLALYIQIEGKLANAVKVEYRIFDLSAGFPGVQLLPAGGGRTEVTTGTGHVATGVYGVYDPAAVAFWKPLATFKRLRVVWYITRTTGAAEEELERFAEALDTNEALREVGGLALVEDVRDAGAAATVATKDIHAVLIRWRDLFERHCRQRFRPVREVRNFRARGGIKLFFPEPLHGLTKWTNGTTVLSNDTLRVWGAEGRDRRNPKVEIVQPEKDNVFVSGTTSKFKSGLRQVVDGVWGFFDPVTFGPPLEITDAIERAALLTLKQAEPVPAVGGVRKREKVDKHEVEYAGGFSVSRPGMMALLKDPAIRDALAMYRAPIGMGTTGGDD